MSVLLGIIGAERAKFTVTGELAAKAVIAGLLQNDVRAIVSGHCHLGGVDIWAEEAAATFGIGAIVHAPKRRSWEGGYKPRNLLIARDADVVHTIVTRQYPPEYTGMRFSLCYHCARFKSRPEHVKSGACWTANVALRLGKRAVWHVVDNETGEVIMYAEESPGTA